jgi:predicted amidohydrolase
VHVTHIGKVRAFALGWHVRTSAGDSADAYRAEMERLVDLVRPHFATDRPNLLIFPEDVDLPLFITGPRGAAARAQSTFSDAFAALALGYLPTVQDAQARFSVSFQRAVLLALTDTVWRNFDDIFSTIARREHVFLSAVANVADAELTTDPTLVALYGDPGQTQAFVPRDGNPYVQAIYYGPDGRLFARARKVNLTPLEQAFDFAPGALADVRVLDTPAGRLGPAISLDAFTDSYVQRLAQGGAYIVVQNDANDGPWCGLGAGGDWQPREWLRSILGALQPKYAPLAFDICPMMVGNFFDLQFDGQTTITHTCDTPPAQSLIAVDDAPFNGEFLFLGPWAFEDPGVQDPSLTLEQRRAILHELSLSLQPGGAHEGQYPETIGWADLDLD